MGTDWIAILAVVTFSVVGFFVAAFVLATVLTSISRRNRRNFEVRHHRAKRTKPARS